MRRAADAQRRAGGAAVRCRVEIRQRALDKSQCRVQPPTANAHCGVPLMARPGRVLVHKFLRRHAPRRTLHQNPRGINAIRAQQQDDVQFRPGFVQIRPTSGVFVSKMPLLGPRWTNIGHGIAVGYPKIQVQPLDAPEAFPGCSPGRTSRARWPCGRTGAGASAPSTCRSGPPLCVIRGVGVSVLL